MNQDALRSFVGDDQETMKISQQSLIHLEAARKWAFFLAVLGFIGIGLMVILSLVVFAVGSIGFDQYQSTPFPMGFLGFVYLIMAVLYFFPVYYLLKFATNMKTAIALKNELTLEEGFRYLKNHYQFIGIITIIIISIYILALIGIVVAGIFAGLS